MARLVIEGGIKYLETIKKENRLRASKYGLKVTLDKNETKKTANVSKNKPQNSKKKPSQGDSKKE